MDDCNMKECNGKKVQNEAIERNINAEEQWKCHIKTFIKWQECNMKLL